MTMDIYFDAMNIAYRCHAIHDKKQGLATSEGDPTGLTYGFLRTMLKWKREYPQSEFHVVWDSPQGKDWRQEKYPDYKADRKYNSSEKSEYGFYDQLTSLKEEFLPAMSITQYSAEGEEADDILGTIVRGRGDGPAIVVSSDRDFLQLIDGKTVLITPDMNKTYDRDTVEEEYGVSPELIVPFRAFDGDPSDNLPGLPYFRKKIISRLVREVDGEISSIYENGLPDYLTEKESEKLHNFEKQAFVNKDLMELKEIDSYTEVGGEGDREKLASLCEKFEFKSIEDDLPAFLEDEGFMKTN